MPPPNRTRGVGIPPAREETQLPGRTAQRFGVAAPRELRRLPRGRHLSTAARTAPPAAPAGGAFQGLSGGQRRPGGQRAAPCCPSAAHQRRDLQAAGTGSQRERIPTVTAAREPAAPAGAGAAPAAGSHVSRGNDRRSAAAGRGEEGWSPPRRAPHQVGRPLPPAAEVGAGPRRSWRGASRRRGRPAAPRPALGAPPPPAVPPPGSGAAPEGSAQASAAEPTGREGQRGVRAAFRAAAESGAEREAARPPPPLMPSRQQRAR